MKVLKQILRIIFAGIGFVFSIEFFLFIIKCLNWIFGIIYSSWIKGQIKQVEGSLSIKFPIKVLNGKNIYIGKNFIAGNRLRLETINHFANKQFYPKLVFGNYTSIG